MNSRRQSSFGLRMRQVMTHGREVGSLRAKMLREGNRAVQSRMGRMRPATQRVEEQNVQAPQQSLRRFRHFAVIGQVCSVSKTKPVDGFPAVKNRNWLKS